METTKIFTESPNQDISEHFTPSRLVEAGRDLSTRSALEDKSPLTHNIYGRQPVGLGFTCGTGRTTVSWSLDGNPISASHKYAGNDGHFNGTNGALHTIKNSTVLVSTDNTTVVAYLRKQGGTRSPDLCLEVWEILYWCFQNKIQLLVKHVPGKFNTLADRLSRVNKPISTEWCLNQEVANAVLHMTQFPNIDLFATRLNHRLPLYVSPIPDQKALSKDALSMNWNRIHAYAFPPFHLIPALINKIRVSQCKIVLIAPFWPSRSWFPELLGLL